MHWLLQLILAFLVADFLSGIVHWFQDNYLDYCVDIPFLSVIAKENEMHHYYPRTMLLYPFWETIWHSCYVVIVGVAVFYFTLPPRAWKTYAVFLYTLIFVSIFSNLMHKYSHMRPCETNVLIRFCQAVGLLQSHEYHSVHHKTSDRRFCVISQYVNPFLDALHFWSGVEYCIFLLTGKRPNRKPTYDEYSSIHTELHAEAKQDCPRVINTRQFHMLEKKLKRFRNHCKK